MDPDQTIILSRVTVPRRRNDLVARPRLNDLLNEVIDKRLILVSAPAGYGKTSLLVDFAANCTMPVCWYSIDRLDQNPQRFISYLTASIQQRFKAFGQRTQAVLNGGQGQFDLDFTTTLFINDLYDHVTEHFVLVLDDYHLVNESNQVRTFINRLLKDMEENIHIVIISRSLLSIPSLPIMVARSEVAGISFAELAFQLDEVQLLYTQNQNLALSLTDAKEILQETEGWVTGIVLASQVNNDEEIGRARLKRVSSFGLESYFLHVIDNLPPELRSFLLWSSLLEEFNADICERVLGTALLIENVPWQKWMNSIQQNNLFVLPVGEQGDWLRYHPLFLEFLQSHVNLEFPIESKKIERQLAADCVKLKQWDRAYQILSKLRLSTELVLLIENAGFQMLIDGRVSVLSSWIEILDKDTIDTHPYIVALQGYIAMLMGDKKLALTLYNQAITAMVSPQEAEHRARTLAMRANIQRLLGNLDAAIEDANESIKITELSLDLRSIKGDALRCIGLCYFHKGKLQDALGWLENAQNVMQSANDRKNEAIVQMEIGLVYENLGNYAISKQWYLKALYYWENIENPLWLANLLNNLGVLYQMMGDYENASISFERALNFAQSTGYTRMEAFILTGIADIYVELQALEQAKQGYEKALEVAIAAQEHFIQVYILVQQAALYGQMGDTANGYKLITQARNLIGVADSEMEQKLCDLEFAGLMIIDKQSAEVFDLLEGACAFFKDEGHKVQCDKAHLYLMLAYIQIKQPEKIISHILHILSNLDGDFPSTGLIAIAARFQSSLESTSIEYLEEQIERFHEKIKEYNQKLPKVRKFLRENSRAVPFAPPRLFVRSLGKMQVRISNHAITNSEWQTQAAKDLFFMLLAHPEGMTKEEISVIFWPEASPEEAKFKFKNTVYRLRRAVGKDSIILEQDFYRFNNKMDYEYDVELFLKENAAASREHDLNARLSHLLEAVKHYGGRYLPEIEEDWVHSLRGVLSQNYISSLLQVAESYLGKANFEKALEFCHRAINEDNLLEDSYRLAFRVYAAMGNRAGLVRQYQNCVDILEREISASPSPQTQDLYQNLLK